MGHERSVLRDRRSRGGLHDMLSDMIEGGRLTEGDIPDDYAALVEQLEQCNAYYEEMMR